jgi:hypothetical protein
MATAKLPTKTTTDTPDPKEWLRAGNGAQAIGVDRENEIIRGVIIAQEGPFKSEGRGEFDLDALTLIGDQVNASPNGLKSRLAHPDESNDGIGKFLGRIKDARLDEIGTRDSEGELKTDRIAVVRADLHIDPSSHTTPSGDIGGYIMDLAESDSDAMSTSLVLQADKLYRLGSDDRPLRDDEGNEIPPLWIPTHLHALDVVDTGDAVDGMLSTGIDVEGLPNAVVHRAAQLMDRQFSGKTREFVRSHGLAWLDRYLSRRFGEDISELTAETPDEPSYDPSTNPEAIRRRQAVEENERVIDAISQRGE